jgi:uracil-DNA glycosylase
MKLSTALRKMLEGWRGDVPAAWQPVLSGTELNFRSRALDCSLRPGEIIIPARNRVFHAFEGVDPEGVRAVILGQDPYPNPEWATGRAFEQGDLDEWPEESGRIAGSLRRIVQTLAAARTGEARYASHDRAWSDLVRDVRSGALALEPPRELFGRLERQGVLFLNASLTLSVVMRAGESKRPRGHFPVWEPLVDRVLSFIAGRGRAVFLLWGRRASWIFERAGARGGAVVRHVHPAAITREGAAFLKPPNPFLAANELLRRMGEPPISW